jgi:hypothetical protein
MLASKRPRRRGLTSSAHERGQPAERTALVSFPTPGALLFCTWSSGRPFHPRSRAPSTGDQGNRHRVGDHGRHNDARGLHARLLGRDHHALRGDGAWCIRACAWEVQRPGRWSPRGIRAELGDGWRQFRLARRGRRTQLLHRRDRSVRGPASRHHDCVRIRDPRCPIDETRVRWL